MIFGEDEGVAGEELVPVEEDVAARELGDAQLRFGVPFGAHGAVGHGVLPHPSSEHLCPALNRKILDVALLRLRFRSIGQAKSAPNPGAAFAAVCLRTSS